MQDNTKPGIPEGFSENEKPLTDKEEITPQENTNFTEPGFEEQEGELLPPDEKKKSSTGKLFLFATMVVSNAAITSGRSIYQVILRKPSASH